MDLEFPRPIDISIEDITTSLAKICRYNGQVDLFYSVAQHCGLVAELVHPSIAFPALLHDASEAYLGDMSSKLKHAPQMDWFRSKENAWTEAIEIALGLRSLTPEERHQIKTADDLVAIFERVTLRYRREFKALDIQVALDEKWITRSSYDDMAGLLHRLPRFMTPQSPELARSMFTVNFSRYLATWRGANDGLIIKVGR